MIFHRPPSLALRTVVLAGVMAYVAVAVMNIDACVSQDGLCILATPAVLVYWAPAFVGTWIAVALLVKLINPRRQLMPSVHLTSPRETAYLRSKGQGAAAAVAAALVYIALRYGTHALASRVEGGARVAMSAADEFLRTGVGIALVMALVFVLSIIAIKRIQGPTSDDWNQLK